MNDRVAIPVQSIRKARPTPKGRAVDAGARAEIAALLGDAPCAAEYLIENLHKVQDKFGMLSAAHLAALAEAMNWPATHVPFVGEAAGLTALMGQQIQAMTLVIGTASAQVKAGKLVPLAVTERARSELMPDVPTASEQGVPGVEVAAWYGVFAPKDTPAATVARLNQEFNAVLQMPEVRSKLTAAGLEPLGGTPQQLDAFVKADHQRYGTLARELNIKAD